MASDFFDAAGSWYVRRLTTMPVARADFDNPIEPPEGIEYVFVNGKLH